jgi:hypothetical protein
MPNPVERINKQTLGSTQSYFEITIVICMYVMGIPSLFKGSRGKCLATISWV